MNQSFNSASQPTPQIRVLEEWHDEIPEDLYIPPAAFEILLEHFEGPLDFLIYLIQKNNFDLLKLDIAPIATQYLDYMNTMKSLNIELTADYMVMAALLADLKSRLLLPKSAEIVLEEDPKQQLVDRLEQYLRIKTAATHLGQFAVLDRDTFTPNVNFNSPTLLSEEYDVTNLTDALINLLSRPEPIVHHVQQDSVSLEERIHFIENKIQSGKILDFYCLLNPHQGRIGIVVTFMALLELTRQQKIKIISSGIDIPLTIQGVHT